MTIHSIQSEGSGISLGPVTAKKIFPLKPGDKSLYLIITDGTGECAMKIWGPAMNCGLREGQSFTITGQGPRGGIQNKEYPQGSGKWTLNASDCRVVISGQESQPTTSNASTSNYGQSTGYSAPQGNTKRVKLTAPSPELDERDKLIIQKHIKVAAYAFEEGIASGLPEDVVAQLAIRAPENYHLSWCGQKGLGDID